MDAVFANTASNFFTAASNCIAARPRALHFHFDLLGTQFKRNANMLYIGRIAF